MPTYDYQCRTCGYITEVVHSMLEDGPTECERCGGRLRRVFHPTGIIFKGGGFYETDYRSESYKKDAKAAEGKSDAKTEGKADTGAKNEPAKSGAKNETPAKSGVEKGDAKPVKSNTATLKKPEGGKSAKKAGEGKS